jgi:AcrR family transcriptional regulator
MTSHRPSARRALLDAFAELALSHRYQDVGVGLIVGKARVARSTFYYHFKAKDDLLLHNLAPMIAALARLPATSEGATEADAWVAHIWEHRARAGRMLRGATGQRIADALARELQSTLSAMAAEPARRRLTPLLAEQIAGSMLNLLRAWVTGRTAATPADVSRMLGAGARALAEAVSASA